MLKRFKVSFVRPSNVTAYSAGDVICDADGTKLSLISGVDLEEGRIVSAKISITNDNVTNGNIRLFFFRDDANIPTLVDNAGFAITAAAEEDMVGYTDFVLEETGSSGTQIAFDYNSGLNIPFIQKITDGVAQGIHGVLVATAAYNPASPATTVDVEITVEQYAR
jgi:hypothetical protein